MTTDVLNSSDRRLFWWLLALPLPLLALMIVSPETFLGGCLVLAVSALIFWLARDFSKIVFVVVLLISWFPEYSQTDWDVWSAEDFHSLYNFKPIPWLTASVFDYFFALAVLIWIIKIGWPQRRWLSQTFLAKPMLWFVGFSVFSLLLGIAKGFPVYYALREFRVSTYFVLFYFMALSTLRLPDSRRKLTSLLAWTGIAVGIAGIVRFRLGIGKEYYGTTLIYYDIADSMVMYVALFVLAASWMVRRRGGIAILLASLPILFSLLFSYRRGAWIAAFVGLVTLLWTHRTRSANGTRRGQWLIPALVVVTLVVTAYAALNWQDLLGERAASIVDVYDDTSNVFRIMDTLNALATFTRHPILGLGYGGQYDFDFYSEEVAPAVFWENASRACHNGFLYILFKMGIFGFVAYIVIFYRFLRRWSQCRRHITVPWERVMYLAMGSGVVAILLNNLTSPVADSLRPALLLALLMACLSASMITAQREQDSTSA
jgi:O-antigen ligase